MKTLSDYIKIFAVATSLLPCAQKPAIAEENENSAKIHLETGSFRSLNSDIDVKKETLELKIKKNKIGFKVKAAHADYSGILDGKNVHKEGNSILVGLEKSKDGLFFSPYLEARDDVDVLREFSNKKVSSFAAGLEGECIVKKPFTAFWDFKTAVLNTGENDVSATLGTAYYFNDDWAFVKTSYWNESLRQVNTKMAYAGINKKMGKGRAFASIGAGFEDGAKREHVYDAKAGFSCKLKKNLEIEASYGTYDSRYKGKSCNVGIKWRF